MTIQNHFSQLADLYSRYRPQYPAALYAYLASLAPGHELAWDCGTGNGQAARGLAEHFDRVWATDSSPNQIGQAISDPRITYHQAEAGHSGLPDASTDLAAAAQAIHWFDLGEYYAEVRRVLKPWGIIAAWTYQLAQVSPAVDSILATYFQDVLGPYWSPRIQLVMESYRTLPFPFDEIQPPAFEMAVDWTLDELRGFLASWSATRPFQEAQGHHPLELVDEALREAWGAAERRRVRWDLPVRVGKVGSVTNP
jgi:ubiquinone/menaquinone biosynthesis C-methylase UbiE